MVTTKWCKTMRKSQMYTAMYTAMRIFLDLLGIALIRPTSVDAYLILSGFILKINVNTWFCLFQSWPLVSELLHSKSPHRACPLDPPSRYSLPLPINFCEKKIPILRLDKTWRVKASNTLKLKSNIFFHLMFESQWPHLHSSVYSLYPYHSNHL